MSIQSPAGFFPPESLIVDVRSELGGSVVQQHGSSINVILRLAMLAGERMELDSMLSLLLDFAFDIVSFDKALVFLWDDDQDEPVLRLKRGVDESAASGQAHGNVFNLWANRYGRPMLLTAGQNEEADSVLESAKSSSALVMPLVVNRRILGSLQLFSGRPEHFTHEHAQLLWVLLLVAEHHLAREHANEGLLRFAYTDYLTGLKTRRYLEQQLDLEIKRSERKNTPLSVVMVDIDLFKQVNDEHGHHAGDQILHDVAFVLHEDMREIDTVARYGGEEFVLVLPETNLDGARHLAQRLRQKVEKTRFFAGSPEKVVQLTISMGIAVFGLDARTKPELIQCADAALYLAKSRGRNQVVLCSEREREER